MALEFPSVQTLGTVWEWAKQNLDTWFRTLGNLKNTVAERDLGSDQTLLFSVQFSLFCVFMSELMTIPIFVISKSEKITFYMILSDIVEYYIFFIIMAMCQKISSLIFFGHGTLRSSVIVTLFASAYLPLLHLSDYILLTDKTSVSEFYGDPSKWMINQPNRALAYWAFAIIALIFLLIRFIPATRFVHRVGWLRATLICILTVVLSIQAYEFFMHPLDKLLLSPAL